MRSAGYSLIEVLVAAVVVAVGLTAATVLIGSIMSQQELNLVSLRAANLQEQAVTLYRLGVTNQVQLNSIMPEPSSDVSDPERGEFSLIFGPESTVSVAFTNQGVVASTSYRSNSCIVVFPNPPGSSGAETYSTNTVPVILPLQP